MILFLSSSFSQRASIFSLPRFLLLRRVDVVHVGLEARERRGREAELGREGLEAGRGGESGHRRFFFSFLLFSNNRRRVRRRKSKSFFFSLSLLSLTNATSLFSLFEGSAPRLSTGESLAR